MKKIICFIFTFFLVMDFAQAAGCNIVSGTGRNIGDEIACGTEYFYILSNDGESVEALSKYNLNVGITIYKELSSEQYTDYTRFNDEFLNNKIEENGYDGIINNLYDSEASYYYGALFYKNIDGEVIQNENAIGAHGNEKGSPEFPEIGVIPASPDYFPSIEAGLSKNRPYGGSGYVDFDYNNDTDVKSYLKDYNLKLYEMGIKATSVNIPTVRDVNSWVLDITGKNIPLQEWYEKEEWDEVHDDVGRDYLVLGSIKSLLGGKHEWIYSTTYWTRTVANELYYQYFIDTLGDLCNGHACDVAVGAGIRPIITLDVTNLIYNIEKEIKGEGSIEVKPTANPEEKVDYVVTPEKGYTIKSIIIIDEDGKIINPESNSFIMPNSDVIIKVEFVPEINENPETGVSNYIILGSIGLLSTFLLYILTRRYNAFDRLK